MDSVVKQIKEKNKTVWFEQCNSCKHMKINMNIKDQLTSFSRDDTDADYL